MVISEQFDQIGKALIQARLEISNPTKSATAHRYKYANIIDVLDAIVIPCLKHGILIQQHVETTDSIEYNITTVLLHPSSNQHITSHIKVAPELNHIVPKDNTVGKTTPIQEFGGAITYMKRYALLAIFMIAGEEDDNDGATSTGQYASNKYITHKQAEDIIRLADSNTRVIDYLKSSFNVNSINQLKTSDYAAVIDLLNKAKKAKQ